MSSLLDIQRKENICNAVLESGQGPERAVNARGAADIPQSPLSSESCVISGCIMQWWAHARQPASPFSSLWKHMHDFFLDFMSSKIMDSLFKILQYCCLILVRAGASYHSSEDLRGCWSRQTWFKRSSVTNILMTLTEWHNFCVHRLNEINWIKHIILLELFNKW